MGIFIYTISQYEWHKLQTRTDHRTQELYHYMNIKIQMQFITSLPYD